MLINEKLAEAGLGWYTAYTAFCLVYYDIDAEVHDVSICDNQQVFHIIFWLTEELQVPLMLTKRKAPEFYLLV